MNKQTPRILIIRFSSIGDIVLTTPVIRSLKQALPGAEIHYLTRHSYRDLLIHNPYLDQLHLLEEDLKPVIQTLKSLKFDYILDLHHNLRSLRVKWALRAPSASVDKKNLAKYRMVRRKGYPTTWLPHIVERYGETLRICGASLDDGGLEIHYPEKLDEWARQELGALPKDHRLAVVLGAKFATKRWIPAYFVETLNALGRPVILLGGNDALAERDEILPALTVPVFDAVNRYSLLQSTAILDQAHEALTHDTGFMHIAAALGKTIYSLWGNTVPALGMTPYKAPSVIIENQDLDCRPCSKIGHRQCPKGHFRCMVDLRPEQVVDAIRKG